MCVCVRVCVCVCVYKYILLSRRCSNQCSVTGATRGHGMYYRVCGMMYFLLFNVTVNIFYL